jgi:hypothetical protein
MVGIPRKARLLPAFCTVAVVAMMYGRASSNDVVYETSDPPQTPAVSELVPDDSNAVSSDVLTTVPTPARSWTIDYRIKSFCSSQTSYEIGTPPSKLPESWAPLSRLQFPLDSTWNGIRVGIEKPNWGMHVEWLTPISEHINGNFEDSDWEPLNPDGSVSDFGRSREHWTDGQTVDLDLECKLSDRFCGMPVEVWPIGGFRFQRFGLTAYDLVQEKSNNQPDGRFFAGDVLTFKQQYYMCYLGGQLRKTIGLANNKELRLTFQGDWGATWGFNIDHHLRTDPVFEAYQSTQGGSWHLGLTAEAPMNRRLSLGVQADFLKISTTGKTWETNRSPEVWNNGVRSDSEQTSITAFGRLRY